MTNAFRARSLAALLTLVACLSGPLPARAQSGASCHATGQDRCEATPPASSPRPSLLKPFADVLGDFRNLPTRQNADWLVVGLAAATGSLAIDDRITHNASRLRTEPFKPGAIVGGTPLELGVSFATHAIGRATNKPRAIALGADLIRAQVLAEILATGTKRIVRRTRPDGTGFSFPSGHTTVTFASATVLQRHFGWKVGVPAYAVALYVAASRVQMKRHYLSDVAFGAALGIVAGRTVTVGSGNRRLTLAPMATPGGGGVGFTWIDRR